MKQTDRIGKMERALDESAAAVSSLTEALERYRAALPALKRLEGYYQSSLWLKDLDDDRLGRLPPDLKRGVLSEDAVWDLLADNDRALELLRELAAETEKQE